MYGMWADALTRTEPLSAHIIDAFLIDAFSLTHTHTHFTLDHVLRQTDKACPPSFLVGVRSRAWIEPIKAA